MDISLARTFLEIISTGSFGAAAERLHITQTAVSARIRNLENLLGRQLFLRNKSGARLTPAGDRFVQHATRLVQVWERARQQVALPAGHTEIISLGAELSLWDPLVVNWLVWMRRHYPDTALRTEIEAPDRLLDRVQDGSLDLAVLYSPEQQTGLVSELLTEERLVMVTSRADGGLRPEDYIYVDWGPAFASSHQAAFPDLASPPVTISLGPLALNYLLSVGGAGYFRTTAVQPYLASGALHPVRQAPEFSHSIYLVYSIRVQSELINRVRDSFKGYVGKNTDFP